MKRKVLLSLVAAGLSFSTPSRATLLITEEEAKLPPPKGAVAVDQRGILRGPKVEFVSPGGSASSPLRLVLKFQSYGGARIDPESVKVIFLRSPNVDLTPRVKPFVAPDGINMQDAELPPGEYTVRVDIKDSDGRPGTTVFTLKVAPK
ncbi:MULTISPECIES: hypothetical protein [Bradyrhizobium]|uniref:Uncharacterized protein n=1 Tax=Bradyrhizobium diversitatis TaxID=2755406 RepID=A0ABS0NXH6_9BRAD|nr:MULTISPECIES: hypothetical protein [Bradyrhizobium]KYK48192.1 hypothetical protein A1D31_00280 [Bradyrhizobium liaoningense]MBH5385715.1 hypothetical protein [Bradyrhizobium diversitatis]UPJ67316.1 hypothetical protein IVB23_08155 [Bradyrhizobium sp. 191]